MPREDHQHHYATLLFKNLRSADTLHGGPATASPLENHASVKGYRKWLSFIKQTNKQTKKEEYLIKKMPLLFSIPQKKMSAYISAVSLSLLWDIGQQSVLAGAHHIKHGDGNVFSR